MFASQSSDFLPASSAAPPFSGQAGKTRPLGARKPGMTTKHLIQPGTCRADGPPLEVTAWRLCRLLEAGFERSIAEQLAATGSVDVHALLSLVDRGCPPALAARILSPVQDWT